MKSSDVLSYIQLNKKINEIDTLPFVSDVDAEAMQKKTSNVSVPTLSKSEYIPVAGNSPKKDAEPPAQLGSIHADNCSGSKDDSSEDSVLNENIGCVIDEKPLDTANDNRNVIDDVKVKLDGVYTAMFTPKKNVKFDVDGTKNKTVIAKNGIKDIPIGW